MMSMTFPMMVNPTAHQFPSQYEISLWVANMGQSSPSIPNALQILTYDGPSSAQPTALGVLRQVSSL
jgi:hypothetical protein